MGCSYLAPLSKGPHFYLTLSSSLTSLDTCKLFSVWKVEHACILYIHYLFARPLVGPVNGELSLSKFCFGKKLDL